MSDRMKWVVIDLGSSVTKVGIVGEGCVRFETPTDLKLSKSMTESGGVVREGYIQPFIRKIVTEKIQLGMDSCKLIILTNTCSRQSLCDSITAALPTSAIINSHAAALICSGFHTGLVLDISCTETRCIPIVEGTVLENDAKFCSLSSSLVRERYNNIYRRVNSTTAIPSLDFLLKRGRVVSKDSKQVTEPSQSVSNPVQLPLSEPYEVLFDGTEDSPDSLTLQSIIVSVISSLEIVQKRSVASNIVITGGLSNVPGLTERLSQEITSLNTLPQSLMVSFSQTPFLPSNRCVIGGLALKAVPAMM